MINGCNRDLLELVKVRRKEAGVTSAVGDGRSLDLDREMFVHTPAVLSRVMVSKQKRLVSACFAPRQPPTGNDKSSAITPCHALVIFFHLLIDIRLPFGA